MKRAVLFYAIITLIQATSVCCYPFDLFSCIFCSPALCFHRKWINKKRDFFPFNFLIASEPPLFVRQEVKVIFFILVLFYAMVACWFILFRFLYKDFGRRFLTNVCRKRIFSIIWWPKSNGSNHLNGIGDCWVPYKRSENLSENHLKKKFCGFLHWSLCVLVIFYWKEDCRGNWNGEYWIHNL